MSSEAAAKPSRRLLSQRKRQARYEVRKRFKISVYDVPLGDDDIKGLQALGWLTEEDTADHSRIGLVVAAVIRELVADRR